MRKLGWVVVAGALFACQGAADTVYLKNGRSIKGKIVKEDDSEVVLRTPGGRVPLPRNLIKRIERTSSGQTALDMGLQRAREGDYDRARQQFRLALDDPDPAVAKRAREELESLPAGSGPAASTPNRDGQALSNWPPEKNRPFPVAGIRDAFGRTVSSQSFRGKVVVVEIAGMHHPYSQAFSGGHTRGGFRGVKPQPDVADLQAQLKRYAGVSPRHPDLLVIQLLVTGPDGNKPPTLEEAGQWAEHFGHARASNVRLWLGAAAHVESGKAFLGSFVLLSRDGLTRLRSRNYPQLLPYVKRFIDAEERPATSATGGQAQGGGSSNSSGQAAPANNDDYGHIKFTNIYPDSLESPPGSAPYPKAIVPLPNPRSLPDVPAKYRRLVNHAMTYVARGAIAKAHAIAALKRGGDVSQARAAYTKEVGALWRAVQSLPRPQEEGMSSMRASLIAAFLTQRDLFEKAFSEVGAGKATYAQVRGWSEVSQQQGNLAAVAQILLKRFDRLERKTQESINTHLGALAGFAP